MEISIDFLKVFTLTMKLSFSLGYHFWVLSRLYIGSEGSLLYFSSCIRILLSLLSSMDWRPDRVSISRMGVDFIPPVINLRYLSDYVKCLNVIGIMYLLSLNSKRLTGGYQNWWSSKFLDKISLP